MMHPSKKFLTPVVTTFGFLAIGLAFAQESVGPPAAPPLLNPIEIQTRGQLHEAFAQPLEDKPGPGELVPQEPPPPITEVPPDERPDIDNAQWMSGYWAWDAEAQRFVWISGIYRVPPRDRTFVPGYWVRTGDAWRWIPGFWTDPQRGEVPYVPEPPEPLAIGPSGPAPDDNSTFIPGAWAYGDNRFAWRPGYWAAVRVGRVWSPSRYLWTPNGYLFINGFWDEPYEARGCVFAPVVFQQPLWRDPNWRYRPNYVVSLALLFDSSFVRGGSFYFGNYYNPAYAQRGFRPWYNGAGRYDPAFAYNGWQNQRTNPNWVANAQSAYANRSAGKAGAPPTTFAQQTRTKVPAVVVPLNQLAATGSVRTVRATSAELEAQQANALRTRQVGANRKEIEGKMAQQPAKNNHIRTLNVASLKTPSLPPVVSQTLTFPQTPGKGAIVPKTGSTPPKNEAPRIINNANPPAVPKFVAPPPKNEAPRIINNVNPPVVPKFVAPLPKNEAPRIINNANPPAVPKFVAPPPKNEAPRIINNANPPVVPKFVAPLPKNEAPRIINNVNPPVVPKFVAPPPKAITLPKNEAPRIINNVNPPVVPKFVAPPPKAITLPKNEAPRIINNVNPPKISAPPRIVSPPPSTPRAVAPPPNAPRISPPPQNPPRIVSPPPAPRPAPPAPSPPPRKK